MGETGLPHVVSFVLDGDGRVLDGTLLHAANECIDVPAPPRAMFYSISCVHPSTAARALRDERAFSDLVARRLVGFDHPEGDDPESFAGGMWGSTKSSAYASSAVVAAQATDRHVPKPPG